AALKVPALTIFADRPLNDGRAMQKASKYISLAQTAGAGHMHQIEVPKQIAAMVRRFISQLDI
ncbi:MAG: hypothetical protein AAF862_17475, partial [Pseudomonadota bacterium]